jgi:Outer membrane protein beta-barrel domain
VGYGIATVINNIDRDRYSAGSAFSASVGVDNNLGDKFGIEVRVLYLQVGAHLRKQDDLRFRLHYTGFDVVPRINLFSNKVSVGIGPYMHILVQQPSNGGKYPLFDFKPLDFGIKVHLFYELKMRTNRIRLGLETGASLTDTSNGHKLERNLFALLAAHFFLENKQ